MVCQSVKKCASLTAQAQLLETLMPSFSLASYILRVKTKAGRSSLQLDDFDGAGADIYEVLARYLGSLAATDEKTKKVLEVQSVSVANRELTGIIEHGEWGYSTDLKNYKTKRVSYKRKLEDVEHFPFYYLISAPQGTTRGIVILQRFSNHGIRQLLVETLQQTFAVDYPGYRISIEPAAPGKLIEQYMDAGARVKELRFIQFKLPRNLEDRYPPSDKVVKEAYSEFVIRATRLSSIPVLGDIRDIVNRKVGISRLIELVDFPADRVKVHIEVGKKTRVLELAETTKMRAYFDITGQVELGANGHPNTDSIDELAHALLNEQYEALGRQAT